MARMGNGKVYTGFWWGNLRERYHLEDLVLHGRIVLKRILKRKDGALNAFLRHRIGIIGGTVVNTEILTYLLTYLLTP